VVSITPIQTSVETKPFSHCDPAGVAESLALQAQRFEDEWERAIEVALHRGRRWMPPMAQRHPGHPGPLDELGLDRMLRMRGPSGPVTEYGAGRRPNVQ
jgi:hypothetical protein